MKTTITKTLTCSRLTPVLIGALAAACAPAMPPQELVDARAQYVTAMSGPAAAETPAQLHTAKTALDQAEKNFRDDGNQPYVRDRAYVALRKTQLAEATARAQLALKAKASAEELADRQQAETLKNTQSALQNTQQALTQEKSARDVAERKAAQAMADLQKIAAVKQETRGMVITLSGAVLFANNEATLMPAAIAKLNEVADALIRGNPDSNITVEGHTDSQGTRDHNMVLSQQRAEAVKTQLVSRGVAGDRIKAVGVGPDRSIADNKSPEGRANNRRVEIVVEPQGGGASQQGPSSTQPLPGDSANGVKR
jgi:outer membrane protein OmpA-like peptidoglycan-associated protein